jgi:nucleotide-binding universal stress UspA family protein
MAQARNIVVGYDGSQGSERALDKAASFVGYGAALAVVHMHNGFNGRNGVRPLDEARRRLQSRQVSASYLETAGEPVEELMRVVRARNADLLVVALLDSSAILPTAPCDVLVVR